MCVWIIMGFPNPDEMCFLQSQQSSAHAARCEARRRLLLRKISEALKTLAPLNMQLGLTLFLGLDKRVVNPVAEWRGRRQRYGRKRRRRRRRWKRGWGRRGGGIDLQVQGRWRRVTRGTSWKCHTVRCQRTG